MDETNARLIAYLFGTPQPKTVFAIAKDLGLGSNRVRYKIKLFQQNKIVSRAKLPGQRSAYYIRHPTRPLYSYNGTGLAYFKGKGMDKGITILYPRRNDGEGISLEKGKEAWKKMRDDFLNKTLSNILDAFDIKELHATNKEISWKTSRA